jgi:hypothetical protein
MTFRNNQMTLRDNEILVVLISIALVVDIVIIISVISHYNRTRTTFAAAHCICPIITFFWLTTILVYTKLYEDSIKSMVDYSIFMPFWIVIVYIIMLLFHWKLFLLRSIISRITNQIILMLKMSVLLGTITFVLQIIFYILFVISTTLEKASLYSSIIPLFLVFNVLQEVWGLFLVILSIKR